MASSVVKVTISLPRGDMERVRDYEARMETSCSGLFREAIELWLAVKEREKVRNIYARVYSRKKAVQNELRLVEEMLPLALEIWPEH